MFLKVIQWLRSIVTPDNAPLKGWGVKKDSYKIQIKLRGLIAIYSTGSNEVQ